MKSLIKKSPLLLGVGRWIRDNSLSLKPAVSTPFGFKFVGLEAMQKGDFEAEETALFRKLLGVTDVFINIGANTGYYCCFALQAEKQTIAFEPSEMNLRVLFRNLEENGWEEKIEIFPLALSDQAGLAKFYGTGLLGSLVKGWSNNPDQISSTVPLNTGDAVLGKRFNNKRCLITLDVEGAELSVLRGCQDLLDYEPKPIWMVEANISVHFVGDEKVNPNLLPLFEEFYKRGYVAWTASENPRRVELSELQKIVETGEDTLKSHNFIFADESQALP